MKQEEEEEEEEEGKVWRDCGERGRVRRNMRSESEESAVKEKLRKGKDNRRRREGECVRKKKGRTFLKSENNVDSTVVSQMVKEREREREREREMDIVVVVVKGKRLLFCLDREPGWTF